MYVAFVRRPISVTQISMFMFSHLVLHFPPNLIKTTTCTDMYAVDVLSAATCLSLATTAILALFMLRHVAVYGQGFGHPDYESDWLLLRAQSEALSFLEVHHDLGQLPALVEVLVKSESEPNKDFIFNGIGNGGRDDDDNTVYGSVLYTYNEKSVRLFAPSVGNLNQSNVDNAVGHVIYTGEPPHWKGVNNQTSIEAPVKIRCWSIRQLPPSCYENSGLTIIAGSDKLEETYLELEHNLHQRPSIVNVRAKLLDGADAGWYIDAQGGNNIWYDTMSILRKTGGLLYGYNNETVRIWTSAVPDPNNVILSREDGWGGDTASKHDYSYTGAVDVRAWCKFIGQVEKTVHLGPDIPGEDLEIELPAVTHNNTFISVKIEPRDGANKGYLFDGTRGAMVNTVRPGTPCSYGGLVYGYNETLLRVWRPDFESGAALCIGSQMGQGTNSQATNSVNVVITVWTFTNIYLREWAYEENYHDTCTHFKRLAEDAKPATISNHIATATHATSFLSCHRICAVESSCLAFTWDQSSCDLYNSSVFDVLQPTNGSEVWGLV